MKTQELEINKILKQFEKADFLLSVEDFEDGRLTDFSREVEINDNAIEYDLDINRVTTYEESTDSYNVDFCDVDVDVKSFWMDGTSTYLTATQLSTMESKLESIIKNILS